MDLALESGWSQEMIGAMTETDFIRWQKYAATRRFPTRRLELYLAQIAMVVAKAMGGSTAKLEDFLIELSPPDEGDGDNLEDAKEAFGFKPRIVKG